MTAIPFLALGGAATAGESSPWVVEGGAKVRLIAGGPGQDGRLRAGIEIALEPGWKTYWLNPGPTGVPPQLDFSGSANLAAAEPLWPAPKRFDDGGSDAVGYSGHFVVPVRIMPEDGGKPVRLSAVLDFGVCEKICIPARARLELEIDPEEKPDALAAIQIGGFEARVPKRARLGGEGALAITSLERTGDGLSVKVRFPPGAEHADLFASAPDRAVGIPEETSPGAFRVEIGPEAPRRLDLVAVADGAAIRVPVDLDGPASAP